MQKLSRRDNFILYSSISIFMFLFAYAMVPLYQIFCNKTGYLGTIQEKISPSNKISNETIEVEFIGYQKSGVNLFPLERRKNIRIGENILTFYRMENKTNKKITGMSIYNVTPYKTGAYFNKIHCFCFEQQTINANETIDLPVYFFIGNDFLDDSEAKNVKSIALSYTFIPSTSQI